MGPVAGAGGLRLLCAAPHGTAAALVLARPAHRPFGMPTEALPQLRGNFRVTPQDDNNNNCRLCGSALAVCAWSPGLGAAKSRGTGAGVAP